ncbi:hypothetical protein COR50_05945 [Chitinophaga caeni]|uniref:Uncharacterized protein n=1 Tax=Chitinophaga caeni TaxID=2029983 RepID=A0A291QS90_9BACT|nr:hypothetical protein [Chitinophaga caeni]ATL46752.1 hypothetical protein COR50_05945 [Chitinophaga caeni]
MENLQLQQFGCQELAINDLQDINGGFLNLANNNGVLTLSLDLNAIGDLLGGVGLGGGNNGGGGVDIGSGLPVVGNLLSTLSGTLNNLLGGLSL